MPSNKTGVNQMKYFVLPLKVPWNIISTTTVNVKSHGVYSCRKMLVRRGKMQNVSNCMIKSKIRHFMMQSRQYMTCFLLTRILKCSTIAMTLKNEALNLMMSKVAPKHLVFSWSHSLKDRIALVVALDSIGYFETITTLLQYIPHQNSFELKPVESSWEKELISINT